MKTTTLQLLPTTSQGTPSGNYDGSSLNWEGTQQLAADYYGGFGGMQTVAYFLSGFQGRITIQATLDSDPDAITGWFDAVVIDSIAEPVTENQSVNIAGNFTWIRARVEEFSAGTITKLTVSY
jgi:hypothetical protein